MQRPSGYSSTRKLGDYKPSARKADHDGWILCDGRTIRRLAYPTFFQAIEVTADTLVIPDSKDCVLIGAGGRLKVLERGGSNEIRLTIEQLPPHDHEFADSYAEATTQTGSLLNGLLKLVSGLTPKSTTRRTEKAGKGEAIKLTPLAIGANLFIYVGEPVG